MTGNTKRLVSLDVLRAIAILLVLGRHMYLPPAQSNSAVRVVADIWQRSGWIGVDLFFVLSGFLVSGLLFKEYRIHGGIKLTRFFVRRALKIYPAFYAYLAVLITLQLLKAAGLLHHLPFIYSNRHFLGELLFLQNYVGGIQPHTWSLAVEEHFYIMLGITVLFLVRRRQGALDPFRVVVPLTMAVALVFLAARIWTTWRVRPYDNQTHLFPTHLRADSLLFGVMLAYLHHFHAEALASWVKRHAAWLLVVSIALIAPALLIDVENPYMHTLGLTALSWGFGVIVLLVVHLPDLTRPIAWLAPIGVYSYSIYLWHFVVRAVTFQLHLPWLLWLVAYVLGAFAFGYAAAKLVELPTLRLRDRLFPSHSGKAEPAIKETTPELNVA